MEEQGTAAPAVTSSPMSTSPSPASPPPLAPEIASRFPVLESTRFEDLLAFEREFDSCVRALRLRDAPNIIPCIDPVVIEMWAMLSQKSEEAFPTVPADAFRALYAVFRPTSDSAVLAALRTLRWTTPRPSGDNHSTLAGLALHIRTARYLFAALGVSPAVQIRTFLNSINGPLGAAIRQSAELAPPETIGDAFAIATRRARQLDDVATSGFAGIFAAAAPKPPVVSAARNPVPPGAHRGEQQAQRTQGSVRLSPLTPGERARCLLEGRCLRCRQKGHTAAECRGPGRTPSPPAPPAQAAAPQHRERGEPAASGVAPPRIAPSKGSAAAAAPETATRPHREKRLPVHLQDYDITGSHRAPQVLEVTPAAADPTLDFPETPLRAPTVDSCIPAGISGTREDLCALHVTAMPASPSHQGSGPARDTAAPPDSRPTVVLTLDTPGRPNICCVLDTGACVSLMNGAMAAELGCTPTAHAPLTVVFGNASRATLDRPVTLDVRLTPDAPKRPVTFMVTPDAPPGPYALLGRHDLAGFAIAFDGPVPRLSWCGQPSLEDIVDPVDLPGEPLPVAHAADGTPEVRVGDKLSSEEVPQIKQILKEFADCFGPLDDKPADLPLFSIRLKAGASPVAAKPRRLNEEKRRIVDAEVDRLLALGIIKPSTSSWAAPIVVAINRATGKPRVCYDFGALNAQTLRDPYPIPATADVVQWFAGKPYLASFDMSKGYMQTPVEPDSQPLLAFVCHRGLFEPTRVLFGPTNAPPFFHRAIVQKLAPIPEAKSFIDDISIAAETFPAFCSALRRFLALCRASHMRLNDPKCITGPSQLPSLGRLVGPDSVALDPGRLAPIRNAAAPYDRATLVSFLGLVQWFASFLPGIATKTAPLWDLAKPTATFIWHEEHSRVFEETVKAIIEAEPLVQPVPGRPLVLRCDASARGVGGVLLQQEPAGLRPLSFFSRRLSQAESKYCTLELEALAILHCLDRGRPLIHGPITVVTDHSNLQFLRSSANHRVQRWSLALAEFDLTIAYAPGKTNVIADFLSRAFPDSPRPAAPATTTTTTTATATTAHTPSTAQAVPVCPVERELRDAGAAGDRDLGELVRSLPHTVVQGRIVLGEPPSPEVRARIWTLAHDIPLAGHVGRRRTLHTVKQAVEWPGMDRDLDKLSAECPLCQKLHAVPSHAAHLGSTAATAPFTSVFIDHLGPLRPSGNPPVRFVLMMLDRFSHFLVAVPVPDTTAATTARALFEEWICRFGVPQTLTSDGGPAFKNALMKEFVQTLCIDYHISAPYHPEGHGAVERANRSFTQVLRALFRGRTTWHDLVKPAAFALNTTHSRLLGTSPFVVTHGFSPRLPIHHSLGVSPNTDSADEPFEFADNRVTKVAEVHARVAALHAAAHKKEEEEYRRRAKGRSSYSPGEHVLLQFPRPDKLLLDWRGPYQVVGAAPDTRGLVYEVEDIVSHEHTLAHVNRMHLFRAGALSPAELLAEACAQEEYLIDAVLAHEYRGRDLWLAVLWTGYPPTTPDDDEAWVAHKDARFAPAVRKYVKDHRLAPRR